MIALMFLNPYLRVSLRRPSGFFRSVSSQIVSLTVKKFNAFSHNFHRTLQCYHLSFVVCCLWSLKTPRSGRFSVCLLRFGTPLIMCDGKTDRTPTAFSHSPPFCFSPESSNSLLLIQNFAFSPRRMKYRNLFFCVCPLISFPPMDHCMLSRWIPFNDSPFRFSDGRCRWNMMIDSPRSLLLLLDCTRL